MKKNFVLIFYVLLFAVIPNCLLAQIQPCNNPTLPNPGSGFGISRVYIDGRAPVSPVLFSNTTPLEEGYTKEYDSSGVGTINLNICKEYYVRLNINGIASVWMWIDYDQDGVFNDSNEVETAGASGFFSSTDAISIHPKHVGKTLYMRVAAKQNLGQLMHPCDTALTKGDVEDYKIVVLPADSFPPSYDTSGVCRHKNLVMNYAFEDLCCCPTSHSLFGTITKNAFPTNTATTDIFSTCAYNPNATVPSNFGGYQQAKSGNNYAGIIVYEGGTNWHEYIQMELAAPLAGGQRYYYEFYISLTNFSNYSVNEFGLYFDSDTVYENSYGELSVVPQVVISSPTFYNDTANWVKISGYYTPLLSGDKFIVFGNFKDSAATTVSNNGFAGIQYRNWSMYYVDDFILIPAPEFTLPAFDTTICFGDSILLSTTGTCFMNWVSLRDTSDTLSTSSTVWAAADSITTLQYVVSGNDGGSLWIKDTFNITVIPYPIANAGSNDTICQGQQTSLSASGGGAYAWSTGASTASVNIQPSLSTIYTLTVSNGSCTDIDSVYIHVGPAPEFTIGISNVLCNGQSSGSITAVPTGSLSYTYLWSTGNTSSSITGLSATSYTLSIIDSLGCSIDSVITITEPPALQINSTPLVYICSGQNVTLSTHVSGGTGSYTYSWNPGGATTSTISVTATSTTQYTVTSTDANGCTAPYTITVSPGPVLTASLSSNISICEGNNITLTSTVLSGVGNYSYSWLPGGETTNSINVNPSTTTKYYLTISDTCNSISDSILVNVNNLPVILTSLDDSICEGDEIIMYASGALTYTWSPTVNTITASGDSVSAYPAFNTTYSVTGTDANNCTNTETINIVVNPAPIVDAGANTNILQGSSVTLTASGGGDYNWSPTTGLSCNTCAMPVANPNISTMYYVTATDNNGCISIDSVYVEVTILCAEVFVPTAFSPNNDGENDVLKAYSSGNPSSFYIAIYNRWGEKVFESSSIHSSWDGLYKGEEMDAGVFTYLLRYSCDSAETIKKGNISLVR